DLHHAALVLLDAGLPLVQLLEGLQDPPMQDHRVHPGSRRSEIRSIAKRSPLDTNISRRGPASSSEGFRSNSSAQAWANCFARSGACTVGFCPFCACSTL